MGNILILDTGYIANNTLSSQTQLSVANRAGYDGSSTVNSFTLQTDGTMTYNTSAKIEDKPVVDSFSDHATTLVSTQNPTLSFSCILDKSDNTSGYSKNQLYQLRRLERTRGLKLLYVNTANTNHRQTMVEKLGAENTNSFFAAASPSTTNGTVSTTTPYIVGRVTSVNITDSTASDKFRLNFNFEVSG